MSIRRMNESFDKKFKEEYAPVEEIKEGYELLDGTKVELYKDYNKASARAKELGLKEAEYGDAYGVSYCMWNTSGDRNEDEEVIAYYKFEGRKPRPLTDDEAERIARDIGVRFEDFDESLKEANEPDLTPKERREFISKMTKALMGDKFGYSHAEANDIAIKRADALGSDWRVRWGGDIDKEIKQELATTLSKADYEVEYGKMGESVEDNFATTYEAGGTVKRYVDDIVNGVFELDTPNPQTNRFLECLEALDRMGVVMPCEWEDVTKDILRDELKKVSLKRLLDIDYKLEKIFKRPFIMGESLKEDNGRIIKFNYTNGGEHFVGYTVQDELDKIDKQNDYFWFTDDKSDIKNGQVLHGWTLPAYLIDKVKDERVMHIIANESLNEGHTWGDTTIEDYVEKNFSGDDESKQKLIDWFVSLDYTNQFGFKDISVKDIFKKANEFGLSRKYSAIESKLSERNLTKAERHNRDMERIFANKKKFDDKYAKFLKDKGYSDEQIKKLRDADDLSGEIARKFTPAGEQPSAILGKILKESQSQEIAYYYRQLKDKNGFDVARLADAFYKTPEWKEIGFQGDVLFTEKGWNAFKKWAKEKKNIEIKDLGSSDDFLGEGRLTEKKWRYTLKNGRALRDAIETEDYTAILATIQLCYQELNEAGIIDDDDCEEWVEELDWLDVDEMDDDDIDYWLDQLYDVCDNLDVWIPLNEDTVKQGSQWVNKGKEGTHGKFKTKKEADAQRKAMYANGFGESKKIPTKKNINEDFASKVDWDELAFWLWNDFDDVEVYIDEQNAGFAKFEFVDEKGTIKGNLIGTPKRIELGIPEFKLKKICYDVTDIADAIRGLDR